MFEFISKGLCKTVQWPVFGKQHLGFAPGGAMDRFSYETGNALLGNNRNAPALEIIFPPLLQFTEDVCIVLTGAAYDKVILKSGTNDTVQQEVPHATVVCVEKGNLLEFGVKQYGFRSYLCYLSAEKSGKGISGRSRGAFDEEFHWRDPDGLIRIMEGPEHCYLDDPTLFSDNPWKVTRDISDMGMRLTTERRMPTVSLQNMVSEAVADGTVQLTPKGPIILLKHRQTVGGYPRIFNVISSDVDLLAQFAPSQVMRFRTVSVEEALSVARQKNKDLESIQNRFS